MSTKLWVIEFDEPRFAEESPQHFSFGSAHHASPQDLVAALIAEGGEMLDAEPRVGYELPPGRWLVYKLDSDSRDTGEKP